MFCGDERVSAAGWFSYHCYRDPGHGGVHYQVGADGELVWWLGDRTGARGLWSGLSEKQAVLEIESKELDRQ